MGEVKSQTLSDLEKQDWWQYMDGSMRKLALDSYTLLEREKNNTTGEISDYGFVVFPMAKAYEGFLKKLFYDLKLIGISQYRSEHFRIGRALSPTLPKRYRAGWVYGKLVDYCQGEELPQKLWSIWKQGRNKVFHFFPSDSSKIDINEAETLIGDFCEAMEWAIRGCEV